MSFRTTTLPNPVQCSICLIDIESTDLAVSHENGEAHPFHIGCIHDWLRISKSGSCPNCRLNITDINGSPVPIQLREQNHAETDALRNQVRVVYDAVINGNQQALETQLETTPLSEHQRGIAVRLAVNRNDLAILRSLIHDGQTISPDQRGVTLISAAKHGYDEIVQELLINNPQIYDDDRIYALWLANKYGHPDVAELLSLNRTFSSDLLGRAVRVTMESLQAQKVQALLEFGPIADDHHSAVIDWAIEGDYLDVVKALLQNSDVSEDLKSRSITKAILKGHFWIAHEFIRHRIDPLCISLFCCFNSQTAITPT